jgi:hypothetical protein
MERKEIRMKAEERDYSHRTLYDKLGVQADSRVALVGKHDDAFLHGLTKTLAKSASTQLRAAYDFIFLRVDAPRDLAKIAVAAEHLVPNGRLWIFHPKGKGASPSDAEVRAAGLGAGLVDNKISGYTDSHAATQYVIPVARRIRGTKDG